MFFLPGVPSEMKAMFEQSVLPALQQLHPTSSSREQRVFKLFGLPEPKVDAMIPSQQLPEGVEVAFALDYPLVLVKLRAEGEDVGARFAEEARKIHFGESDPRGIYGKATQDEVSGLLEDGVAVMPLPDLPEDLN